METLNKKIKIIHMSSAHPDKDVRIFFKECVSLANNFHPAGFDVEVHLILSGVEERTDQNVRIHSVEHHGGSRLKRMWSTVNAVYRKAIELDGDIYHFHDPELLRIALKLKRAGKKVVYDAHEDLPRQLMGKAYLKFKKQISAFFENYENSVVRKLDAVITATPFIRDRFLKINPQSLDVNNFPLESEIEVINDKATRENYICFIGGISKIRGTKELVDAMQFVDCTLHLAGGISEDLKQELVQSAGWKNVKDIGFIDRKTALEAKKKALAGVVTFLPLPNHVNAQPNKIFEYMASGLPVIGSHFPLWKEMIVDNHCGICVNPEAPNEIAEAIKYLQDHPDEVEKMGENGKRMVAEKYNWNAEEKKLFTLYEKLIYQ